MFLDLACGGIDFTVDGHREQPTPALCDLFIGQDEGGVGIDPHHDVDVVARHGVGMEADGKNIGKFQQSPFNPLTPCS